MFFYVFVSGTKKGGLRRGRKIGGDCLSNLALRFGYSIGI
jgi:hypothetical protein